MLNFFSQEAAGYFFCLEDRALLCRKCDIAIHTANSYVSAHQRFLVTGVRVDLESTEHAVSSTKEPVNTAVRITESSSKPLLKRSASSSLYGEASEAFSSQLGNNNGLVTNNVPFSSGTTPGSMTDWPLDDFFGLTDFNQNYGFTKHTSKVKYHSPVVIFDLEIKLMEIDYELSDVPHKATLFCRIFFPHDTLLHILVPGISLYHLTE